MIELGLVIVLSVCVIGRNSEKDISRAARSLEPLKELPFPVETIFVDSASVDKTVETARIYFDAVYVMEDSSNLSAAAGRYIGTLKASGDWILYLDADMELCETFIEVIRKAAANTLREGVVGEYRNDYGDGRTRKNILGLKGNGEVAPHFGGAVLLPREAVLDAGNWNPRVYSNEETELYTRLKRAKCIVRSVDTSMVVHHTLMIKKMRMLLNNFIPLRHGYGKKFFGIGQVFTARILDGSFGSFIKIFPYPFVYWSALLLSAIAFIVGYPVVGAAVILAGAGYIYKTRGLNFLVVYLAFLVQAALGCLKYDRRYVPAVAAEYTRTDKSMLESKSLG